MYALHSNFQLFPNDGIAAPFQPDGMRYGSQVEQDDARFEQGSNVRVTQDLRARSIGRCSRHSAMQIRDDVIESQLHRTEERMRLDGCPAFPDRSGLGDRRDRVGAYVRKTIGREPWLRVMVGGRADRIDARRRTTRRRSRSIKASGYRGATQISPKAARRRQPVARSSTCS